MKYNDGSKNPGKDMPVDSGGAKAVDKQGAEISSESKPASYDGVAIAGDPDIWHFVATAAAELLPLVNGISGISSLLEAAAVSGCVSAPYCDPNRQ